MKPIKKIIPKKKKERNPIFLNVKVRKQTPENERQFQMALRLFLTEFIRQTLSASGERQPHGT